LALPALAALGAILYSPQAMSGPLFALLIAAMLATLAVLFIGLFSMARGGEFNKKYGNKLMRFRVAFQGAAILIFIILMLALGK
jgi:hypothetical protein